MKVYRYLGERELKKMLNGEVESLGRKFLNTKCSTHKYNPNKKYLHFFRNKSAIEEIQRLHKTYKESQYICEFDIPMIVLMFGMGFGYYRPHGYDCDNTVCLEFKVSADIFKPEWLKKYERVKKVEESINLMESSNC